ncbi:L,D-transpeptidase [Inconstantimicrobium mannanitabidum]|uniref:Uncharacterized protein n=1 Tax=Inconstantimicrobium mannanitabidum TaxID=1604901 RepID=A0ACB5RHK0_9CLOT|nr:L,D-transpeptidase [Clostridium sp. TW13]GKX68553.1 hypothetical protein rsdtw13_38110 [Clostridium sp. TW13]
MRNITKKSVFILFLSLLLITNYLSTTDVSAVTISTAQRKINAQKLVNSKGLSSKTKYLIYVDLKSRPQTVYVFKGKYQHWSLINSFTCSGGLPGGKETVTGQFTVQAKGSWFFSSKYQQGGKYYTQFCGNYLFHGLPMNRYYKVVDWTLGKPASHGCIRLAVSNAKWIYNYMTYGTKVYIPYAY